MPAAASPSSAVDLAIVGGGPVGLFAAFYAGLRQMSVKIVDSLEQLGGQLATLYPDKYIYDVAGFSRILAKDLVRNLAEQGLQFGAIPCLGEEVQSLEYDEAAKLYAMTTVSDRHLARTILIAAGIGAFHPRRLAIEGIDVLEGRGLHYSVHEQAAFKDKRLLIVGGGDSAVDWANALAPPATAASLTIIHRRDAFRAHEQSVALMRANPSINVQAFYELGEVLAEVDPRDGKPRVTGAVIYDNRTKSSQKLQLDAILVNIGFESSLGPVLQWGLDIDRGGGIRVNHEMRTSRPGIYAAGDVARFPGKLKLIATGFSEACVAVNFAKHYIDPAARVFPGHSSEMAR